MEERPIVRVSCETNNSRSAGSAGETDTVVGAAARSTVVWTEATRRFSEVR